jgi:hypothetical protein
MGSPTLPGKTSVDTGQAEFMQVPDNRSRSLRPGGKNASDVELVERPIEWLRAADDHSLRTTMR